MFDRWIILKVKATGERTRIYEDDLDEILEDQGHSREDVEILPITEAKPGEIAELIADEAENANYHDFVELAGEIHRGLKKEGFSKKEQSKILWIFANTMGNRF